MSSLKPKDPLLYVLPQLIDKDTFVVSEEQERIMGRVVQKPINTADSSLCATWVPWYNPVRSEQKVSLNTSIQSAPPQTKLCGFEVWLERIVCDCGLPGPHYYRTRSRLDLIAGDVLVQTSDVQEVAFPDGRYSAIMELIKNPLTKINSNEISSIETKFNCETQLPHENDRSAFSGLGGALDQALSAYANYLPVFTNLQKCKIRLTTLHFLRDQWENVRLPRRLRLLGFSKTETRRFQGQELEIINTIHAGEAWRISQINEITVEKFDRLIGCSLALESLRDFDSTSRDHVNVLINLFRFAQSQFAQGVCIVGGHEVTERFPCLPYILAQRSSKSSFFDMFFAKERDERKIQSPQSGFDDRLLIGHQKETCFVGETIAKAAALYSSNTTADRGGLWSASLASAEACGVLRTQWETGVLLISPAQQNDLFFDLTDSNQDWVNGAFQLRSERQSATTSDLARALVALSTPPLGVDWRWVGDLPTDHNNAYNCALFAACGLDSQQLEIFERVAPPCSPSVSPRICLTTGGPGTGKSTVIGAIVAQAQMFGETVWVTSFTARAVARAQETVNLTAKKLSDAHVAARRQHQRFELARFETMDRFLATKKGRAPDTIIIDEVSMVEGALLTRFLRRCALGCFCEQSCVCKNTPHPRIFFFGDENQLPPPSGCSALDFLLDWSTCRSDDDRPDVQPVSHVRLVTDHRTAFGRGADRSDAGGFLGRNIPSAFAFRQQNFSVGQHSSASSDSSGSSVFFPHDDESFCFVDIAASLVPFTRQVVAATTKLVSVFGRGNVICLLPTNQLADEAHREIASSLHKEDSCLKEERVMINRNNHRLGVRNGDFGVRDGDHIVMDTGARVKLGKMAEMSATDFEDSIADNTVIPGGAITVHKSQGGEWDAVVVGVPAVFSAPLLREQLFTAITRAKRRLVIVGDRRAIDLAIGTARPRVPNGHFRAIAEYYRLVAFSERVLFEIQKLSVFDTIVPTSPHHQGQQKRPLPDPEDGDGEDDCCAFDGIEVSDPHRSPLAKRLCV